jgi:POT family proton-dependent oligopeptide transporter
MSSEIAETPPPEVTDVTRGDQDRHPTALWFFFWGEFAERCSYYGMRAILPLYLTGVLAFSDQTGGQIYAYFKMSCYMLPLLGGFLADRYFGRYWTIVGFSVPYVMGHFILGIPNQMALFIALALLAGGSGVIKPNISTLMGQTYDRFRPGNEQLRSAAFLWFYFSINVGAFISLAMLPWIRTYCIDTLKMTPAAAYATAFQFPAWLMVAALIIFALGKPYYAPDTFERPVQSPEMRRQQWETLARLFGIFALIVLWWTAYEQNDAQWTFFSRDYVHLTVPGIELTFASETSWAITGIGWTTWKVSPDQIQSLNALFVLIFVPIFAWLFRRYRITSKMLMGFALTIAASGLMSAAGFLQASTGEKVSIGWVVTAYIVLTAGEVLLYAPGLELAYTAAPKQMKGFVAACYLLTNTLGNLINGTFLAPHYNKELKPGPFFLVASVIVLAGTIGFYFVGRRFDRGSRASEPAAA